ncbi:uncharacterized protein LOC127874422 isoform X1 [Dreissena polymorpha]|uniref:uncharacterized protein LOC127874422 isoform X1 n=1 Tax=Dreissena polymorpha TaxID=45954 RepID=UPI0022643B30|nr:uncharacterized protein LOC127874422 isoform X1 [Dreissena polymorpha]
MAAAVMVPFSHLLQVYVTICLKFNIDTRLTSICMIYLCCHNVKATITGFLLVASVMSRTVTIYDSLGGNNKALFDLFCQFMCQRGQIVKDGLEKISSELKAPPCNKQRHGNSCGVFALMTAKCLVIKKHPTMLRQAHDSVYRD